MLKIRDPKQAVNKVKCHFTRPVFPMMKIALDFLNSAEETEEKEEVKSEVPAKEEEPVKIECNHFGYPVIETVEVEAEKEELIVVEDKQTEAEVEVKEEIPEVEVDPRVFYMQKVESCEAGEARDGLTTLFDYGFTSFESNLAMLRSCDFSVNMAVNGLIDAE